MKDTWTEMTEDGEIKWGLIQQYLDELPQEALHLGIRVILALVFFLLGMQLIQLLRNLLKRTLQQGQADAGVIHFLDSFIKVVLMILLVFMIASGFGLDAASVAAVLGTVGVAIGLAVQGSLSNLAGGVLIMLLRPFKVGDYIKEDTHGNEGTVAEIDIIYTKLQTPDHRIIILPNGILANNSLTNTTACKERRMDLSIPVSYDTDIRHVRAVIEKVMAEDPAVLKENQSFVYVEGLALGRVMLGVCCWLPVEDYLEGKWRITENIKYALDQAGVVIPKEQMAVELSERQSRNEKE